MKARTYLLCISVGLLVSCSPKVLTEYRTKVEYRDRERVDTLLTRDSIYIKEYIKGDTVRITEYRDRYIYRNKVDTVRLEKVDTIAVETVKEVKVEKPLSWAQRLKIGAFWWLLALAFGLGVWTLRKPLIKLLKI